MLYHFYECPTWWKINAGVLPHRYISTIYFMNKESETETELVLLCIFIIILKVIKAFTKQNIISFWDGSYFLWSIHRYVDSVAFLRETKRFFL